MGPRGQEVILVNLRRIAVLLQLKTSAPLVGVLNGGGRAAGLTLPLHCCHVPSLRLRDSIKEAGTFVTNMDGYSMILKCFKQRAEIKHVKVSALKTSRSKNMSTQTWIKIKASHNISILKSVIVDVPFVDTTR